MADDPKPSDGSVLTDEDVELLRELLARRPRWLELARGLDQAAKDLGRPALQGLANGFVYELIDQGQSERRELVGGIFASPIGSPETGSLPPAPQFATPALLSIWRTARDAAGDCIASSRLSDLLYVATGNYAEGLAAAEGLRSVAAEQAWTNLDRAYCASRALELTATLNHVPALAESLRQAQLLFQELLVADKPGSSATVLWALGMLRPKNRPENLGALVEQYVDRWKGTPYEEGAWQLGANMPGSSESRRTYRVGEIGFLRQRGAGQRGLGKAITLQKALLLATQYGFRIERDEILKELQDLPGDEMGFESFTAEVEVDTPMIRQTIDRLAGKGARDLGDALGNIGAYGPPGGNDAEVDAATPQSWVNQVFGTQVFAPGSGVAQFLANGPEAKRRFRRAQ